jgi:hypothetical protein
MFSATATIFRLFKYGLVCIIYSSGGLVDGLVIGKFCNPTHACYKVSLSLLSQAVITILMVIFWKITIYDYWWFNSAYRNRITFYTNTLWIKNTKNGFFGTKKIR